MVHLVAYELKGHRPAGDYLRLAEAIKAISGTWCHFAESKYLVETDLPTQQVASRLAPHTRVGDPLFVTRIYRDWSAYSLTAEQIAWLNARNFGSFADLLGLPLAPNPLTSLLPEIGQPVLGGAFSALYGRHSNG
jgi:hypothetical protein